MGNWLRTIGIIISLLFCVILASAQDDTGDLPPEGNIVVVDSAFVRSGPSNDYTAVGALFEGDEVFPQNISEDGQWILIPYSRGSGWIQRNLVRWEDYDALDFLPVLISNITPTPRVAITNTPFIPTQTPDGNYINVEGASSAYVRAGPGRGYLRLGQFLPGETVEPIARNEDTSWIMVRFSSEELIEGFGWLAFELVYWEDIEALESLPIIAIDNLTPTITFTPSATPSRTPIPTETATNTETVPTATQTARPSVTLEPTVTQTATETATVELTATLPATETATVEPSETNTPLSTQTASPTNTAIPSATPNPTETETDVPSATPSDTNTPVPSATDTPEPSQTPEPTSTNTTVPSPNPTETPSIEATELVEVAIAITNTPTETEQPTETQTLTPTSAVTDIFAIQETSAAEEATTSAIITQSETSNPSLLEETSDKDPTSNVPIEAIVGITLLLVVLAYIWFYWQGLAMVGRYEDGFVVDMCPVCNRGHLHVDNRQTRTFGIPAVRRTVRCDECRSVLRQTGTSRWRYAVDRLENPTLYDRLNGREITDTELERLAKSPSNSGATPRTSPEFTEGDSE